MLNEILETILGIAGIITIILCVGTWIYLWIDNRKR